MTTDTGTDELTVTTVLPVVSQLPADSDPPDHAEAVGLVYVNDDEPGITRHACGTGFTYRFPDGETVPRDHPDRERAAQLAIPPAWTDVWVCPDAVGHIQATGRDDAGRKQYIYHPRWREVRDATKFHRMETFASALPGIRETLDRHIRKRRFTRHKVLALVVALLDETLIRVGNDEYARAGGAHGLTTLENDHLEIDGSQVRFAFPGKSGQERELVLRHRRLARQLLKCEEIPGQRLFAYETAGRWHDVASGDVNEYLTDVAGDDLTAKDFRTWGATVVAAETLRDLGPPDADGADANVRRAIDAVAERLGNTRAVAQSSYVDPRVPKAYRFGRFDEAWDDESGSVERMSPPERAVRRILRLDMPSSSELEELLEASVERTRDT